MFSKFWAFLMKFLKLAPPEPAPVPPPNPSEIPIDDIHPDSIVWDEPAGNVGAWERTAILGKAHWTGDGIRFDSLVGTDDWPVRNDGGKKPTIGNWWIGAVHTDGLLHFATSEWLGKGKLSFGGKKWNGHDNFHGEALNAFRPKSGMVIYTMASGCARAGAETVKKRTQIQRLFIP